MGAGVNGFMKRIVAGNRGSSRAVDQTWVAAVAVSRSLLLNRRLVWSPEMNKSIRCPLDSPHDERARRSKCVRCIDEGGNGPEFASFPGRNSCSAAR